MMKFVAMGLSTSVLGIFSASPALACGGGSCSTMSAAPVATAQADRSYSYQPSGGTYRPQMMMRGGSGNSVPRSAESKAAGN